MRYPCCEGSRRQFHRQGQMPRKNSVGQRPAINMRSLASIRRLGSNLARNHRPRHGEGTYARLAERWRINEIFLRRARLFAERCSVQEVREFSKLGLSWTQTRVLVGVPSPARRRQLARRAVSGPRRATAEQISQMVAPYVGQKSKGRPTVDLRRVRRLAEAISDACQRCRLVGVDRREVRDAVREALTATREARRRLQTLETKVTKLRHKVR